MPSEASWTAMFYGLINGSGFKWLQKQFKDSQKNCRLKITNQQVDWENWRPYGSGELLLYFQYFVRHGLGFFRECLQLRKDVTI